MLNVGARSVRRAHLVLDAGVPELAEIVERGEIAVSIASEIARRLTSAKNSLRWSCGQFTKSGG
jgi:hypothetical protein